MIKRVNFPDCSFSRVILKNSGIGLVVFPSQYLLVQSQLWKHQKNEWSLFKLNNKDNRATIIDFYLVSFLLTLWEDFAHWSGVFIVDFELLRAGLLHVEYNCYYWKRNSHSRYNYNCLESLLYERLMIFFWTHYILKT